MASHTHTHKYTITLKWLVYIRMCNKKLVVTKTILFSWYHKAFSDTDMWAISVRNSLIVINDPIQLMAFLQSNNAIWYLVIFSCTNNWTHFRSPYFSIHCSDVTWSVMAIQITGNSSVCSTYVQAYQRKHRSSASLALCKRNPPGAGGLPSQRTSSAENVPVSWRHHAS